MAITVSGTTITFNDATTQTTAAGAAPTEGNGITVTSGVIALGVPSNSSVGTYTSAIASVTNGTIGTDYTIGTTVAGSNLNITSTTFGGIGTAYGSFETRGGQGLASAGLSGTWKAVSRSRGINNVCEQTVMPSGLWIRSA